MRIQFQRSGGVAGIVWPVLEIDTAALPAEQARQWHDLAAAADFFNLPANPPASPQRDQFVYRITVEEGGKQNTIRTSKGSVSAGLDSLIDHLEQAARAARRPSP